MYTWRNEFEADIPFPDHHSAREGFLFPFGAEDDNETHFFFPEVKEDFPLSALEAKESTKTYRNTSNPIADPYAPSTPPAPVKICAKPSLCVEADIGVVSLNVSPLAPEPKIPKNEETSFVRFGKKQDIGKFHLGNELKFCQKAITCYSKLPSFPHFKYFPLNQLLAMFKTSAVVTSP